MIFVEKGGLVLSREGSRSYEATYAQPRWRRLIALAYCKYHMAVWPIVKRLERLERRTNWYDMPLGCRQDIRCYHLMEKQRVEISLTYGPLEPRAD